QSFNSAIAHRLFSIGGSNNGNAFDFAAALLSLAKAALLTPNPSFPQGLVTLRQTFVRRCQNYGGSHHAASATDGLRRPWHCWSPIVLPRRRQQPDAGQPRDDQGEDDQGSKSSGHRTGASLRRRALAAVLLVAPSRVAALEPPAIVELSLAVEALCQL